MNLARKMLGLLIAVLAVLLAIAVPELRFQWQALLLALLYVGVGWKLSDFIWLLGTACLAAFLLPRLTEKKTGFSRGYG